MKKQDVLKGLRESAIEAYRMHEDYMQGGSDARRLAGAICALKNAAGSIFGWWSTEHEEFEFYFKNRFKQFPQPKQIEA